jgi:hypothetical protein
MDDISDLFREPNAGAYEKEEKRKGPPLAYVGEKLRRAVESAHDTYQAIERDVPDNLPQPARAHGSAYSTKQDGLVSPAYSTFIYSVTAYLALYNMLGMITDPKKVSALLAMKREDLSAWLDGIEREGSVHG